MFSDKTTVAWSLSIIVTLVIVAHLVVKSDITYMPCIRSLKLTGGTPLIVLSNSMVLVPDVPVPKVEIIIFGLKRSDGAYVDDPAKTSSR